MGSEMCIRDRFREGAVLIKCGETGDSMFILCEGLLDVRVALKEGQAESRVAMLQAGMFFGEMSVLTGEPRSATIIAATDALVFEISKDDIAALIRNRPELAETIAQAVTTRKLRNSEAAALAGTTTMITKKISMTSQLVAKMLSFFGIKAKPVAELSEVDQIL